MKVLITGANGFIGKNLRLHLSERKDIETICFTRSDTIDSLRDKLRDVDFVFHLAGVNRPKNESEFLIGNTDLSSKLCQEIEFINKETAKKIPVIFTSSTQAAYENPYGKSKRLAEDQFLSLEKNSDVPVHIFRLPNIFGKWCKPNYNSVVATFCHNIAHNIPIKIHDNESEIRLAYIDDIVRLFISIMDGEMIEKTSDRFSIIKPVYSYTVGELAQKIHEFQSSRTSLISERVGTDFVRALHATYLSYLPTDKFAYSVPQHSDPRGTFVEMLKTPDCGQFSFFTAHPGVTRGGHYHHSKTEKFLVIDGEAQFRFRHMLTNETYELVTSGDKSTIVETVPGWTHDITNIGKNKLVVMLWANEIFDREHPDTFPSSL